MSATMDVDLFSEYFNKSPVLYLEGRQHPIQIYYTKQAQSDYLQAALVSIFQIHQVVFSISLQAERKFLFSLLYSVTEFIVFLMLCIFFIFFLLKLHTRDLNTAVFFPYLTTHVESAVFPIWIKRTFSLSFSDARKQKPLSNRPSCVPARALWAFFSTQAAEHVLVVFRTGGPAIPWHLSLHDRPRGDRGPGEDVSGHRQAPAWQLRSHGSDSFVRVAASGAAAQGLPACSQGKDSHEHAAQTSAKRLQRDVFVPHWFHLCTTVLSCIYAEYMSAIVLAFTAALNARESWFDYFPLVVNLMQNVVLSTVFRVVGRSSSRPTLRRRPLQSLGSNTSLTLGWWRPNVSILVRVKHHITHHSVSVSQTSDND